MKKAIVLCSGGLDSVVTAYYVKNKLNYSKITLLFFNYGQKSLLAERKSVKLAAKRLKAKFIEVKLNWLNKISDSLINAKGRVTKQTRKNLKDTSKEGGKWYVPARNLVFITNALSLADAEYVKNGSKNEVFVGFKNEGGENFPDTSPEFVNEINQLSKISTEGKFKIIAPLIKKDKEDIVLLGNKLDVDLANTFTCYTNNKIHCGVCLACRLRQEGFYWANVKDPTKYKEKMKDFKSAD